MTAPPPASAPGRVTPRRVVAVAVGFFALVGAAVAVVDMFDVAGLSERFDDPVWIMVFDGFALDFLHWAVLAAGALLGAHLAGRLRAAGERSASAFWVLASVALALLLINDAGTPLNFFGTVALRAWDVSPHLTEAALLGAITLVLAYALVRHGRAAWAFRPARGYLVAAVVVYAAAVGMGTTGWKWYAPVGGRLDLWLFRHRLPRDDALVIHEIQLMEVLVEGSAELLAAALFLALAAAFRAHPAVRGEAPERAGTSA